MLDIYNVNKFLGTNILMEGEIAIKIKEILDTDKAYPEKLKRISKHPSKLYAVRKYRIIAKS